MLKMPGKKIKKSWLDGDFRPLISHSRNESPGGLAFDGSWWHTHSCECVERLLRAWLGDICLQNFVACLH